MRKRQGRVECVIYLLRSTHLVREVKVGLGTANSHDNGKVPILASDV